MSDKDKDREEEAPLSTARDSEMVVENFDEKDDEVTTEKGSGDGEEEEEKKEITEAEMKAKNMILNYRKLSQARNILQTEIYGFTNNCTPHARRILVEAVALIGGFSTGAVDSIEEIEDPAELAKCITKIQEHPNFDPYRRDATLSRKSTRRLLGEDDESAQSSCCVVC